MAHEEHVLAEEKQMSAKEQMTATRAKQHAKTRNKPG